jgi:ParB family chromosome partitioning protein
LEVKEIPLSRLHEAEWNPNRLDERMEGLLAASLGKFGNVLPLVVRQVKHGYEVIGGNQRLRIFRSQADDLDQTEVPCVVLKLGDDDAKLLAQALNRVHGEDDPTARFVLLQSLLESMSAEEIASILPESADALSKLSSFGNTSPESIASEIEEWERARSLSRLESMSLRLTQEQRETIERAIDVASERDPDPDAMSEPIRRGRALALICGEWLSSSVL